MVLLAGTVVAADRLAVRPTASTPPPPVPVAEPTDRPAPVRPLERLREADVLLTSATTIPADRIAELSQLHEVTETTSFRYGTVDLAGARVPTYGVDPSTFRNWATQVTAASDPFWTSLASGQASASFRAAEDLGLRLGNRMPIAAARSDEVRLGSFSSVGLPDAEAVLSEEKAARLGLPESSGVLVSAPGADLSGLTPRLASVLGDGVAVRPLRPSIAPQADSPLPTPAAISTPSAAPMPSAFPSIPTPTFSAPTFSAPAPSSAAPSGAIPGSGFSASVPTASSASVAAVIEVAKSRIGAPYVYGATGPDSFDCSGFTSWVYRQVGISLPRTAQEQWASAGSRVSYADAQPGDLLAWAGDRSAPSYVTHIAIYLGDGQMIVAPRSGTTVGIRPVYTSGLLGAVRVLR